MLILGLARNIESAWAATAKSLRIIFDAVPDYKCIIVESNSSDNTLKLLNEWADSRTTIVSLGNLTEPSRTIRIGICRNKYMELIQSNLDHEYTLILDLDESLEIEPDFKQQLEGCFKRSDWDAVASNRRGNYYDIWALRCKKLGVTFDCWEKVNKSPAIKLKNGNFVNNNARDTYVHRYQSIISPSDEWIPCESAFGCMVLYKTASIKDRRYDGTETCEHISFHKGLKMFINPAFISGRNWWETIKH
jgi:hypothetical protein